MKQKSSVAAEIMAKNSLREENDRKQAERDKIDRFVKIVTFMQIMATVSGILNGYKIHISGKPGSPFFRFCYGPIFWAVT